MDAIRSDIHSEQIYKALQRRYIRNPAIANAQVFQFGTVRDWRQVRQRIATYPQTSQVHRMLQSVKVFYTSVLYL